MKRLLLLVLLLSVCIVRTSEAVQNGYDPKDYFPLTGKLVFNNLGRLGYCTVTKIAPDLAITAAHCVEGKDLSKGISFISWDGARKIPKEEFIEILVLAYENEKNLFGLATTAHDISRVLDFEINPAYTQFPWRGEGNENDKTSVLGWKFFGPLHWDSYRAARFDVALLRLEPTTSELFQIKLEKKLERTPKPRYVIPKLNYFKNGVVVQGVGFKPLVDPANESDEELDRYIYDLVRNDTKSWYIAKMGRENDHIPNDIERTGLWALWFLSSKTLRRMSELEVQGGRQIVSTTEQRADRGDSGGPVFVSRKGKVFFAAVLSRVDGLYDFSSKKHIKRTSFALATSLAHNHDWLLKRTKKLHDPKLPLYVEFEK